MKRAVIFVPYFFDVLYRKIYLREKKTIYNKSRDFRSNLIVDTKQRFIVECAFTSDTLSKIREYVSERSTKLYQRFCYIIHGLEQVTSVSQFYYLENKINVLDYL